MLSLYTSRNRQCALGYDSSWACDSFQIGEMIKFLANKGLLFLVDFSPAPPNSPTDYSVVDVYDLLTTLRQCPSYQIDKHHTNCGLRTRLLPILEYIQTMLSSNIVAIASPAWKTNRAATTWVSDSSKDDREGDHNVFRFTRSSARDQRLRYEGAMAADSMAKQLFTAKEWNWTPDEG